MNNSINRKKGGEGKYYMKAGGALSPTEPSSTEGTKIL